MVLDEVIHDDLSKRFNNEMNTQEGRGQEKEMWPARGGKFSIWNIANNTTDTASNRKPLRETLRAVVAPQARNCLITPATTCPPMGEIASQKTSRTTTAGS